MSRSRWGPVTWYFLHAFAENVDDDIFTSECESIKKILSELFSVLPCPTCSNHAVEYIKKSNFKLITKREHLKIWLFNFHNNVNTRINNNIFTIEQVDELYTRANTIAIFNAFIQTFDTRRSEHMMMDSIGRKRVVRSLTQFMNVHRHTFRTPVV